MEITYEKLRTQKTRARIAFIAALAGALAGAAGGLYWYSYQLTPTRVSAGVDFYLNFLGYQIGKAAGLWDLAGGLGTGASTPEPVRFAQAAFAAIGERGWRAALDVWRQIGWCSAGGALAGVALLGAITTRAGEQKKQQ